MIALAELGTLKWMATFMAIITAPGESPRGAQVDDLDGPSAFTTRRGCERHARWASPRLRAILVARRFPDTRVQVTVLGHCGLWSEVE